MDAPAHTAAASPRPGPAKARPGKPLPQNIADVLAILHILIGYGLHLADTLDRRARSRSFSAIAQFFGTARLAAIQARLARGLLRCMALERVLLARAARGRDLVFFPLHRPAARPARPPAADPAGTTPPPRPAPVPRPDPNAPPDPDHLPTLDQLQAELRRRPVGRALADICHDLGIAPSLCDGGFWLALSEAIMWYRGNLPRLMKELRRREVGFCDTEADRNPALDWPEQTRDGLRRILGFRIGEPPVAPVPPAAAGLVPAIATGPP